jgi:hypothetical protein
MRMQDNRQLLRESLISFRAVTEQLINAINNDLPEELDRLFINRQALINSMEKLQYSKEEFTIVCNELDIFSASKTLEETMIKRRDELKEKMNGLRERTIANKSYANSSNIKKNFFSTKI